MTLFQKLNIKIRRAFYSFFKPVMLSYFQEGKIIPFTRISSTTFIDYPQNLKLAQHVYVGHYNFIEASNNITINEGCQITNYVNITTHSSHDAIRIYGKNYVTEQNHEAYLKGEVFIDEYTFVGPHVTIMPNTKIGKGSIIQAYAYVKGNFPDYAIIGGNPAKVVGSTQERDSKILNENPSLKKFYFDNDK